MQIIRYFLQKHKIFENTFAVGVSGGADSLALVLMMKKELPQARIIALTVDHKLRPSSSDEAYYVAQVMKNFQIEHHILTWNHEQIEQGIEEQARIARYKLMCDWCKKHQISYLAIAHHLFDQAETFLMRLQRGSGLFGLAAIDEVSTRDTIKIIRPFLDIHPKVMKDFLIENDIHWVEDESNESLDFLRVRLRKFLPLLSEKVDISPEKIGYATKRLRQSREFIEDIVEKTINSTVHFFDDVGCSLDYAYFQNWHAELKFRILSRLITQINGRFYIPEASSLETLIKKIDDDNFENTTLGNTIIEKNDLRLWIIKENRSTHYDFKTKDWEIFIKENPTVRGLKIPYKLKLALVSKKLSKN